MNTKKKTDWSIFIFFLRTLVPLWDKVLLVLLLAILVTILDINTIVLPLLVRKFIDQVLGRHDWFMFKVLLGVVVFQIVFYLMLSAISEIMKYVVSLKLGIRLGMDVFTHILRLPLRFFQSRSVGEHMYRTGTTFDPGFANLAVLALLFEITGTSKGSQQPMVGNDVDAVLGMITQSFDLLIRVVFRLLLIFFTISLGFDAKAGIALAVFCVPYIWVIHWFYNRQRKIDARYRIQSQTFLGALQQWFAGIKTVKAFGKGRRESLRTIGLYVRMLRVEWQNFFMKLITDNFIYFFRYTFIVGILIMVCCTQKASPGTVFGLYLLLEQFLGPINMAIRVVEGIRLQLVPARRLIETMVLKPSIVEKPHAISMQGFGGPLRTEKVTFGYSSEQDVLHDLSVHFPRFRRTAIVGPSGSGKTSLVNLMLRFYDPKRGSVKADKIDLRDLDLGSYYRNFGIVFQEDLLFSGTIRENIRYGKPDATQDEIEHAAREASVHDDIMTLPKGYDTDIGEGTKLSGGQRQRIAIARALIRKPSILLFDEATHSLDFITASEIEKSLKDLSRERTVIVITHRLTSLADFDEIVVIEKGRVREKGTFDALIRRKGRFYRLLEEQERMENAEMP